MGKRMLLLTISVIAVMIFEAPPFAYAGITEIVSVDSDGNQLCGQDTSVSGDGRYVAFTCGQVYVRDMQSGITEIASVDSYGNPADSSNSMPRISDDGSLVAFRSYASNLVPGDTNWQADIFVHDRLTGVTERVSVDSAGNQSDGYSGYLDISPDGRYVVFDSWASNLVPGDTNGVPDIFMHDRVTGGDGTY